MNKYKLKPKYKKIFKIVVALFLVLVIAFSVYKYIEYRNSNYYKLTVLGYTKEQSKNLTEKYPVSLQNKILKTKYNDVILKLIDDKYFLEKNFDKYLSYYKTSNDIKLRNVVIIINTNRNKELYSEVTKTDITKNEKMIINKYYYLEKSYIPKVVKISNWYTYGSVTSSKISYDAFIKMYNAAKKENIKLVINSGYRSYIQQDEVYKEFERSNGEEYAEKYAARPGFSEHQTGLAFDIVTPTHITKNNFENSDAYKWLIQNAHKYGFILRYPKGKENITGFAYESWHYRFVGVDIATKCKKENITFDEYYAYYIDGK